MRKNYWKILLLLTAFLVLKCENSLLKWNLPKLASIETLEAVKLSNTSVRCSGNISDDGGNQVIERGICYSKNMNPTVNDGRIASGEGTGLFNIQIDGLEANTNYYFRAYAITKTGTAYGNVTNLKTGNLPSLITTMVNFGINSAIIKGVVSDSFNTKITERGICYGLTQAPTISDHKVVSSSAASIFSVTLSGLSSATKYYARAYAINGDGTGYGNEISFTTASISLASLTTTVPSDITLNSAISGGDITNDGGSAVSERGVCYSTSTNPTISSNKISGGTGTGSFTSTLTNLNPGTTYYIRAYATTQAGTAYGNELSFSTVAIVLPTLSTAAVSSITVNSGITGGTISNDGGSPVTERGVCYSKTAGPTVANDKITSGSGTGTFTATMTGLTPKTTYYIRAYAVNSIGTAYGNEVSFTTASIFPPALTTATIESVSFSSAVSGGSIISDGGGLITEKGVCFSTSTLPTIADNKISSENELNSFSTTLTNLSPGTQYYVRAYAINSAGTGYGNEINFTTTELIAKGSVYGGGIIFYVDESGKHGLIAAPSDQRDAKWGCPNTDIPLSESTAVGSGSANTQVIINTCKDQGTAARICYDLVLNGYSDWYLPGRDELVLMYANLKQKNLGNFSSTDYWSSSQQNNKNSWIHSFSSGKSSAKNKNTSLRVRAIRSF